MMSSVLGHGAAQREESRARRFASTRSRAGRKPMHSRAFAVAGAVLAALVGVAPAISAASSGSEDRAQRIEELEGLLGELSAEEAEALSALEEVRSERLALDSYLAQLSVDIDAATVALADASASVDELTVRYLDFDRRKEDAHSQLREARERFESAAVALYQSGGSTGRAASMLILDAADPLTVGVGTTYLVEVSGERRGVVESLSELESSYDDLLVATEESRREASEARARSEEEAARLQTLRMDQETARADVAAAEAREAELVAQIQARQDDYEAELAALRATSNAITDMLLTLQSGQTRSSSFIVERPVPGQITSGFGLRVHPILGSSRMHNGIDMAGAHGSTVSAGASGTVVWAGPRSGYGNTVIVDHGNQYATLYAHLSQTWVYEGESVSAGQGVGAVGATGLATGPHLHFEVRLLGVPTNPLNHM